MTQQNITHHNDNNPFVKLKKCHNILHLNKMKNIIGILEQDIYKLSIELSFGLLLVTNNKMELEKAEFENINNQLSAFIDICQKYTSINIGMVQTIRSRLQQKRKHYSYVKKIIEKHVVNA